MALGGFSGRPLETGSQAGPGGGRVGAEGVELGPRPYFPQGLLFILEGPSPSPKGKLRPARLLSDFSKVFVRGGWKGSGVGVGVGSGRSQPCGLTERKWERPGCLLWGRAVIREVTHGPPPFPPLCPSLKFLISFWARRRFCHPCTGKGVSRR